MEILTFAQLHDALHSLGAFADTLSGFMDAAVQAPAPAPVDPAFAVPLTAPDGSPAEAMTSGKAGEVIDMSPLALFMKADRPGTLHMISAVFVYGDINLTKIQSRPTKRQLGDYMFFVDLE